MILNNLSRITSEHSKDEEIQSSIKDFNNWLSSYQVNKTDYYFLKAKDGIKYDEESIMVQIALDKEESIKNKQTKFKEFDEKIKLKKTFTPIISRENSANSINYLKDSK